MGWDLGVLGVVSREVLSGGGSGGVIFWSLVGVSKTVDFHLK